MEIFEVLFYQPIFNFLIFLYRLLGDNLGYALIGIALVSRIITIPVTNRQIKSAEKNKEFQEKYSDLKKKYKKDKEKLTQESAKLQAEYLPGQLGGCLPLIVQLIMFLNIFNVLQNLLNPERGTEAFNEVAYSFIDKFPEDADINEGFLSIIDLGQVPGDIGITNIAEFWPYGLLILSVIVAQFASAKILTGMSSSNKDKDKEKKKKEKKKKEVEPDEPDFSEIMQNTSKQMIYILPLMIGFISYRSSAGLTLYWTVQSAFVIIQRLVLDQGDLRTNILKRFSKKNGTTGKNTK